VIAMVVEINKRIEEYIGVCGICCLICPAYNTLCSSCRKDPRSIECAIYKCALERGVKFCFKCSEFPCKTHYEEHVFSTKALNAGKEIFEELRSTQ